MENKKKTKENKDEKINDELLKLHDGDMDNVAGGTFWQDEGYDDGHEKSCFARWHWENECKSSPDGYHYWVQDGRKDRCTRCGLRY